MPGTISVIVAPGRPADFSAAVSSAGVDAFGECYVDRIAKGLSVAGQGEGG